jgi:hypothetical protein
MEHGRRTSWTGRSRPQHVSVRGASATLGVTGSIVWPASTPASYLPTNSKISSSSKLIRRTFRPAFLPFLTGSAPQTELAVTHSKQRTEKFLTGARMHIKGSTISTPKTQKLARVKPRNRHDAYGSCAFLPGSVQKVECDVTYSKQSIDKFLPGATTAHFASRMVQRDAQFGPRMIQRDASLAHSNSSNIDTKLSEGCAWLRL